jgi:hypothetical protein
VPSVVAWARHLVHDITFEVSLRTVRSPRLRNLRPTRDWVVALVAFSSVSCAHDDYTKNTTPPTPAAITVIKGDAQQGVVGQPLSDSLVVLVVDADGQTSLLLRDGRVLHSGSGDGGGSPTQENAEVFSPPYLFKGARPVITSAPSSVGYDENFSVDTPNGASIAKVSLIRLGSVTHAFDENQRFNQLTFSENSGGLSVHSPANRNVAPQGHYLLFLVNANGVPSVAKMIRIQ